MKRIYLSPSMQENNIGVNGYGTEEKRMNQLCDIIQTKLKLAGYTTFRNNTDMTLAQIVLDSNAKKPDIHFAIHSNAFNGKAQGAELWIHKVGGEAEKLAKAVYKYIEPLTPSKDRGIKEGYNRFGDGIPLYELAYTKAPAVLIEVAFHDNPDDAKFIIDNMTFIANAIVKGINDYCGVLNVADPVEVDYKAKYDHLLADVKNLFIKYQEDIR